MNVYEERLINNQQTYSESSHNLNDLNESILKIKDKSKNLLEEIQYYKQQAITSGRDALNKIKQKNIELITKLEGYKKSSNPHTKTLTLLESKLIETPDYNKVDELQKLHTHQKFLMQILTKKDSFIRKILLEKHLQYLNKRLQFYLHNLGLPHKVEFTNTFTAKIMISNHILDFGNLSNGQRSRVNIALSLAFRDYLQSVYTKINICLFDEILDVGLDGIGVQMAAKILQHKAQEEKSSIYIISHRDEITHAFDHRMVVTLQHGFSYLRNIF
jgi:DNA repair exonuclease SbcCD ATPase subunit